MLKPLLLSRRVVRSLRSYVYIGTGIDFVRALHVVFETWAAKQLFSHVILQ